MKLYRIIIGLSILFLCGVHAKASDSEYNDYTIILTDSGKALYGISLQENILRVKGNHSKSPDVFIEISYYTEGFIVAREKANGVVSSLSAINGERTEILKCTQTSSSVADTIFTTYTIDAETFVNGLKTIYTEKELTEGINAYLNSVFSIGHRTSDEQGTAYFDYWYIMNEMDRNIVLNAAAWGYETKVIISNYYDVPIFIKLEAGTLYIIGRDNYGNQLYKIKYSDNIVNKGTYDYSITEELLTATDNEKQYYYKMLKGFEPSENVTTISLSDNRVTWKQLKAADTELILLYEEEKTNNSVVSDESKNKVYIKATVGADNIENELFDVMKGIPTQESLYAGVMAPGYIFDYKLKRVYGTKSYAITVKQTYKKVCTTVVAVTVTPTPTPKVSEIHEDDSEEIQYRFIYETTISYVTESKNVNVVRSYKYWKIDELRYYIIDNAEIASDALNSGVVTLPVTSYYTYPKLKYDNLKSNIKEPIINRKAIYLPQITINCNKNETPENGEYYSSLFTQSAQTAAENEVGELLVSNDILILGTNVIINGDEAVNETPDFDVTSETIYGANTRIQEVYTDNIIIPAETKNGIYEMQGTVAYKCINTIGTAEDIVLNINDINNVTIHTPVYCKGYIYSDNNNFVQLCNPLENVAQLVMDNNTYLNDFEVYISNFGFHSEIKGYGLRDYDHTLKEYIKSNCFANQVKFTCEVYMDVGNDKDDNNDIVVNAGEWITITQRQRFYTGLLVEEGQYDVIFRSLAVNCAGSEEYYEKNANHEIKNYAATDSGTLYVSGRLYGFKVINIEGEEWGEDSYELYSGICDSYGNEVHDIKQTLPNIAGTHYKYNNLGLVRCGQKVNFEVTALGTLINNGGCIKITARFYAYNAVNQSREEVDIYYYATDESSVKLIKHIYEITLDNNECELYSYLTGSYVMPAQPIVVSTEYGINEIMNSDIIYDDTYLIVAFDICAYDIYGNKILDYLNYDNYIYGYCSMWITEGCVLNKKDSTGAVFNFKLSDCLVYHTKYTVLDEYGTEILM